MKSLVLFKSNQIALIKSKALRKKAQTIFLKVIPLSSLDVILDYGELGNFRFIMHSYTVLISQGKI